MRMPFSPCTIVLPRSHSIFTPKIEARRRIRRTCRCIHAPAAAAPKRPVLSVPSASTNDGDRSTQMPTVHDDRIAAGSPAPRAVTQPVSSADWTTRISKRPPAPRMMSTEIWPLPAMARARVGCGSRGSVKPVRAVRRGVGRTAGAMR
jgi:hypothetical protein